MSTSTRRSSTPPIRPLPAADCPPLPDAGLGALRTESGNLPLESVDVTARITGLTAGVDVAQVFRNPFDVRLEATYVFPLPDRAAVTAFRLEADGHVIDGVLKERGQARADYDRALAEGRRAAIAEEDRPDVFTIRVGNIEPGERVTARLTLCGPLPYEDGEATFRFPLVVAPRYIPGSPLPGAQAGDGVLPDTDAAPDASRITPPVLLPGFPDPVRLSITVHLDPAGLGLREIRSSLHAVVRETDPGQAAGQAAPAGETLRIEPGERLDRDFVLRLRLDSSTSLVLVPDDDLTRVPGDGESTEPEGTFALTVLPPDGETVRAGANGPAGAENGGMVRAAKDVVLLLDRSGSMMGWKMIAARRAAARIVDSLTAADRFAVLAFDSVVERPPDLGDALVPATDRNRYRAVEHLARLDARGGTELLRPLEDAIGLLGETAGRDRVLVLVTDGQVGNEDQILERAGARLGGVRVHTVGVDRAVNAGFLGRLAAVGSGRCELVESEDRLDEAMEHIHRRIGAPLVTDLSLKADGLDLVPGTLTHLGSLFPGVPLTVSGRFRGAPTGSITVHGTAWDGGPWERNVPGQAIDARTGRARTQAAADEGTGITGDPTDRPTDRADERPTQRPADTAGDRADDRSGDGSGDRVMGEAGPRAAGAAEAAGAGAAIRAAWARARLRDLEDRYAIGDRSLEQAIVATSLRFGVLCRFTAFVAVDSRVTGEGGPEHRVIQPVEPPSGWEPGPAAMPLMAAAPVAFTASAEAGPPSGAPVAPRLGFSRPAAAPSAAPPPGAPAPGARPMPRLRRAPGPRRRRDAAGPVAYEVARAVAVDELARLKAAETLSVRERLDHLADLGSRLVVLAEVAGRQPDLMALAVELVGVRPGADLDRLWRHAVEVLARVAKDPTPGGAATRHRSDRAFWKRT